LFLQNFSKELLEAVVDSKFLEDLATPFRDVDDDWVIRRLSGIHTEIAVFSFDPSDKDVLKKFIDL